MKWIFINFAKKNRMKRFLLLLFMVDCLSSFAQTDSLNILSIGNSFSCDAFDYVPYLMKELAPDVNLKVGILYRSACRLEWWYQYINNDTNNISGYTDSKNYVVNNDDNAIVYFKWDGDKWNTFDSIVPSKAINDENWDIISLQQYSRYSHDYSTISTWLGNINEVVDSIAPFDFGRIWMETHALSNGGEFGSSLQQFNEIANASKNVLNDALVDDVIPYGCAIENARTTSLVNIGNNMTAEGTHLKEGIPSLVAAYTLTGWILKHLGRDYHDIYKSKLRITEEWADENTRIDPNGEIDDSNEEDYRIAQLCAIKAIEKPFEISEIDSADIANGCLAIPNDTRNAIYTILGCKTGTANMKELPKGLYISGGKKYIHNSK